MCPLDIERRVHSFSEEMKKIIEMLHYPGAGVFHIGAAVA
jgi:hypothetical protein